MTSGDACGALGAVTMETEEEDVAAIAEDFVYGLLDSVGHAAQSDGVATGAADVGLFEFG